MRFAFTAAALLFTVALSAAATVVVTSATVAEGGVCVDLISTGATSVTMSVDGRRDLGFVRLRWTADDTESLTVVPLRPGLAARSTTHGRDDQQRLVKTVWIPTTAEEELPFRVQVHEGAKLVADYAYAGLPGASSCAAAP